MPAPYALVNDMPRCRTALITAVIAGGLIHAADAADRPPTPPMPEHPGKMKMNEPMSTGMMKKGMMKGDVKRAAEKNTKAMQPMMEQEQAAMPDGKAKKP